MERSPSKTVLKGARLDIFSETSPKHKSLDLSTSPSHRKASSLRDKYLDPIIPSDASLSKRIRSTVSSSASEHYADRQDAPSPSLWPTQPSLGMSTTRALEMALDGMALRSSERPLDPLSSSFHARHSKDGADPLANSLGVAGAGRAVDPSPGPRLAVGGRGDVVVLSEAYDLLMSATRKDERNEAALKAARDGDAEGLMELLEPDLFLIDATLLQVSLLSPLRPAPAPSTSLVCPRLDAHAHGARVICVRRTWGRASRVASCVCPRRGLEASVGV